MQLLAPRERKPESSLLRVAPLKPVTIPRLKLTAAVCSVRISQQLQQELEYTIDQGYFWTDSKVVLGYIANESRGFLM